MNSRTAAAVVPARSASTPAVVEGAVEPAQRLARQLFDLDDVPR